MIGDSEIGIRLFYSLYRCTGTISLSIRSVSIFVLVTRCRCRWVWWITRVQAEKDRMRNRITIQISRGSVVSYRMVSDDVNCGKGVHSVCTRRSVCDFQSKSHTQVFRLLITGWLLFRMSY